MDLDSAFKYCNEHNISDSNSFSNIYNNCSGKHAAMLAMCKYKNYSLDDYLSPTHPLQKEIQEIISEIFQIPLYKLHIGIDGCSAPAFAMTVYEAAFGFSRMMNNKNIFNPIREIAINKFISCITKYPEMIWGTKGFDSNIMKLFNGKVITKRGASGVQLIGLVNKSIGFALKLDDGIIGRNTSSISSCFLQWSINNELIDNNEHIDIIKERDLMLNKYSKVDCVTCINSKVGTHYSTIVFK
jgi:L-asparaginase II